MTGGHDDQAWAKAHRLAHRHGGVDAKAAGRVGAGSHHAAAFGAPADGKGLTHQRRVTLFFDGAEEGVEVKVEDFAGGWHGAKEPERPRLGAT